MRKTSLLSEFKLYYEDIYEPSYWRRLIRRTTAQLMREHNQRPLAALALATPARVRRKQKQISWEALPNLREQASVSSFLGNL